MTEAAHWSNVESLKQVIAKPVIRNQPQWKTGSLVSKNREAHAHSPLSYKAILNWELQQALVFTLDTKAWISNAWPCRHPLYYPSQLQRHHQALNQQYDRNPKQWIVCELTSGDGWIPHDLITSADACITLLHPFTWTTADKSHLHHLIPAGSLIKPKKPNLWNIVSSSSPLPAIQYRRNELHIRTRQIIILLYEQHIDLVDLLRKSTNYDIMPNVMDNSVPSEDDFTEDDTSSNSELDEEYSYLITDIHKSLPTIPNLDVTIGFVNTRGFKGKELQLKAAITHFNLLGLYSVETHVQQSTRTTSDDWISHHISATGAAGKHILWKQPSTIQPHLQHPTPYFVNIEHRKGDTVLFIVHVGHFSSDANQAPEMVLQLLRNADRTIPTFVTGDFNNNFHKIPNYQQQVTNLDYCMYPPRHIRT